MTPELKKGFLLTQDKVSIAYEHALNGRRSLVIICPGFFNSMQNRWMKTVQQIIARHYDTCIFDFRGHGKSSGIFTWLARERFDLEAVLDYVRGFDYDSIGIIGFSLGAAVSINTVGHGNDVAAMVLVSAPMSFWEINYHFWEPEMFSDLKDNFECGWEGKGARTGNMFLRKPKPLTQIRRIKNIPIMFIHGTKDWIIKDHHSRVLYEAYHVSQEKKKLVLIKDGLHAERLVQNHREKMEELMTGWFQRTLEG
ncbi:MAG: alpha/beta fold hydrolase [Candidatus Omnitrophica bacterium]|nr:alpha/beta fold hydrolase [Candidatus Omnitrophota bacterium]